MIFRRLRTITPAAVRLRPDAQPAPMPEPADAWPSSLLPLTEPDGLDRDSHRPHPAANAWPDDAVLLTYAELRRLVALHLELCAATCTGEKPWAYMRARAAAVRDGEAPLLVAEVMEP